MSKTIIPTIKLLDDECNILFQSITEKLNIKNPKFFYPIYKKVIDDETITPEELRCTMLDSKFKCKQILAKLVDSDDEEQYDSDSDYDEEQLLDKDDDTEHILKDVQKADDIKQSSELLVGGSEDNSDGESECIDILNPSLDININDVLHSSENEDDDINNYEDDAEINEAINNTYFATAIIERTNKTTGEKTCKEEKIHIKKSALLEPLKIMKDEYVLPSKIQNKNISDESLKNTMNKLNSYNNSGHVESLFLYLGNKLVESGKCPSFPYYYGCINGDDPNYHHNITDEYESVSRTKWFRDRVKTDFDLLIIEDDDLDDYDNKILNNANKTLEDMEQDQKQDQNLENSLRKSKAKKKKNFDSDDSDNTDSDNTDSDSDNTDSDSNSDEDKNSDKSNDSENKNNNDSEETQDLEKKFKTMEDNIIESSLDFIKDMDTEDLDFNIIELTDIQNGGSIPKCVDVDIKKNQKKQIEDLENSTQNKCTTEECREECNTENSESDFEDFIEELSDIDKDNLSIGDFENNNNMYYIKCESMPVSLSLMEKLDCTLDDILDDEYNMKETEWFGIFFQVAFGLAVAQKYFNFVHNDLHSSNVMFKNTESKFLYFQIGSNYYCIPTYGKITKIIDFARGTFKFGDRWVFSDQFKEDNDANGQYDYPVDGTLKNCEHKPNPSFDLVRLGTTVIQRLDEMPKVREFVEQITMDDNDTSLCYDEDSFQLYIDIAHNCHNAIPIEVMKRPEFERFKINNNKVPKGQYVFKY